MRRSAGNTACAALVCRLRVWLQVDHAAGDTAVHRRVLTVVVVVYIARVRARVGLFVLQGLARCEVRSRDVYDVLARIQLVEVVVAARVCYVCGQRCVYARVVRRGVQLYRHVRDAHVAGIERAVLIVIHEHVVTHRHFLRAEREVDRFVHVFIVQRARIGRRRLVRRLRVRRQRELVGHDAAVVRRILAIVVVVDRIAAVRARIALFVLQRLARQEVARRNVHYVRARLQLVEVVVARSVRARRGQRRILTVVRARNVQPHVYVRQRHVVAGIERAVVVVVHEH